VVPGETRIRWSVNRLAQVSLGTGVGVGAGVAVGRGARSSAGFDPEGVGIEPGFERPTDVVPGEPPRPESIVKTLEPLWFELAQATATKKIATRKAPIGRGRIARIMS